MLTHLTPDGVRKPFAAYSHAVEIAAGARLVFCSGQLGISPTDAIPESAEAQAELCFAAIATILASAGMTLRNVVRINAYVTGREHMKPYMAVRDRLFPAPSPASTLMIVGGFTREEFKVEVEVVAAG
ncbi:MAG: RidA family protein [Mesorhizobium sp.]